MLPTAKGACRILFVKGWEPEQAPRSARTGLIVIGDVIRAACFRCRHLAPQRNQVERACDIEPLEVCEQSHITCAYWFDRLISAALIKLQIATPIFGRCLLVRKTSSHCQLTFDTFRSIQNNFSAKLGELKMHRNEMNSCCIVWQCSTYQGGSSTDMCQSRLYFYPEFPFCY